MPSLISLRQRAARTLAGLVVPLLIAGCGDELSSPTAVRIDGQAHIVNLDPSAPGYFLNDVAPSLCFRDQNDYVADVDTDWLDDYCEMRLANAFSPYLQFTGWEDCPGREPAWAAKYFNEIQLVRIAYMPAYYRDCGIYSPFGVGAHDGDAEIILIDIVFNASTNHWEFDRMWTSAHHYTPNVHSYWSSAAEVTFPHWPKGAPQVWVSRNKHANYHSYDACNNVIGDTCFPTVSAPVRDVAYATRNAGSRFVDLMGCVYAQNSPYSQSGRCEGFYYNSGRFKGWTFFPSIGNGATPYRDQLLAFFEYYDTGRTQYAGPGPTPPGAPGPNPYWIVIYGPDAMLPGATCHFSAATNLDGGQLTWYVNDIPVGSGVDLYHTAGASSFTLKVSSYTSSAGTETEKSVQVSSGAEQCFEQ